MAVTIAWNEPFVGAQPSRPFHLGSVRSKMEAGRSSSESRSVLYTSTRARPEMPIQRPAGDCAQAGTRLVTSLGSTLNMPACATAPRPPGS